MPPNLLRKVLCFAQAATRVSAAAKARNVSFFSLFLSDTMSVFGNRQDHDKHDTFVRLHKVSDLAPYLTHTVFVPPICQRQVLLLEDIRFPAVIKPVCGLQSIGVIVVQDRNVLADFLERGTDRTLSSLTSRKVSKSVFPSPAIQLAHPNFLVSPVKYLFIQRYGVVV
jgi:hypothetical protein